MDGSGSHTRIWKNGRLQDTVDNDAALAALCQAVERAVRAHQSESAPVRAVVLVMDQPAARVPKPEVDAAVAPVPVYVDVFDSGFGQDSGYGHGI